MRITKAGNRIVLDEEGSLIENKRTGNKIQIRHENGCFVFDLWAPARPRNSDSKGKEAAETNNGTKGVSSNSNAQDGDDMEVEAVFARQEDLC